MMRRIILRFFSYILLVPFLVLSGGCSSVAEPKLEQWKDGGYQTTTVSAYEITGKRDGAVTRASAILTLESGEQLRIELEVVYDPEPALGSGHWTLDGGQTGSGDVLAESLKFLGGQGEGPSLGGRFRLDENGDPRFRVFLPLRPVSKPGWTID